jgi:hypothetical protein
MPVLERDPWRYQFFEGLDCPEDVMIPTDDPDCWLLYPRHRWIYDKLRIAESQGLACGPHGIFPGDYPVYSKPVTNLKGMGIGGRVVSSAHELDHGYEPGHMWMPYFTGPHVSTDCAVLDGRVKWMRHATGETWKLGMFRYWTIHATMAEALGRYLAAWVSKNMAGYSGMMNFETISGRIIEAHLRFADQWCDLYGKDWLNSLVSLYRDRVWRPVALPATDGYSIPLFARHGEKYHHPPPELQAEIRAMPHVNSLQITFYNEKEPAQHPMPPGGFRLGLINCTDLEAGFAAKRKLAAAFPEDAILWQDEDVHAQTNETLAMT